MYALADMFMIRRSMTELLLRTSLITGSARAAGSRKRNSTAHKGRRRISSDKGESYDAVRTHLESYIPILQTRIKVANSIIDAIKAANNRGRFENISMFFSKITHKSAITKKEIAIPTPPRRGIFPE